MKLRSTREQSLFYQDYITTFYNCQIILEKDTAALKNCRQVLHSCSHRLGSSFLELNPKHFAVLSCSSKEQTHQLGPDTYIWNLITANSNKHSSWLVLKLSPPNTLIKDTFIFQHRGQVYHCNRIYIDIKRNGKVEF